MKITENTTNETLELELGGTHHSVSSDQPITIQNEQANELIMALKEIYHIKLGPLPALWKHHNRPIITDYKIGSIDNTKDCVKKEIDQWGVEMTYTCTFVSPNRCH